MKIKNVVLKISQASKRQTMAILSGKNLPLDYSVTSPPNIFFIANMLMIDWSITYCDVVYQLLAHGRYFLEKISRKRKKNFQQYFSYIMATMQF
jgi:hypothetical protein